MGLFVILQADINTDILRGSGLLKQGYKSPTKHVKRFEIPTTLVLGMKK
jgi:hypothetical protein